MARVTNIYLTGEHTYSTFIYELRGYHVYMKDWQPKENEVLFGVPERDNPYDANSIAFVQKRPAMTSSSTISIAERETFSVVGHIPLEISRIAHSFISRGGKISARVVDRKLHPSNKAEGTYYI